MSARPQKLTRGSVVMTATKVVAVIIGYATNVYLARQLGPNAFGLFGVAITVLIWLELIVAEGLPLWVARTVDTADDVKRALPRSYMAAQFAISLVLVALLALAAPLLARVFQAPESVLLFRIASIDIPIFGFYNLFLGVLLGAQLYGYHSGSVTTYNISKLLFTVIFVGAAGLSAVGAVLGSISASVFGLVATVVLVIASGSAAEAFRAGGKAREAASLEAPSAMTDAGRAGTAEVVAGSVTPAVLLLLQALMLAVGLWLVRALVPGDAAGFYRAASLVAIVPVELSAGITWALYSAYSTAYRRGDTRRCRHYISQTIRVLLAGGIAWVAVVGPTSGSLLALLFSSTYATGASILAVLSLGYVVGNLAVTIAPTMLVAGRGRLLVALTTALLVLEVGLGFVMIPRIGGLGGAVASGGTLALAGIAMLVHVRHDLDFELLPTLVRMIGSGVVVALVAHFAPVPKPAYLIAWYPLLGALFFALLWVTRAITPDDIESIREGLK